MKKSVLKGCVSIASIVMMSAFAAPAFAQDTAPADATDTDATGLDAIVVTASGKNKSQLNSSVSVTSISSDLIQDFKPSSEAEVFRMIPGIQVGGTSGPGGNSNIAVRGLPVATGGSPFVQIQEDGLPTVLFGDIQFGNNDYWTHFDASVANVESVRGGSSSTFASQAPGAVINYISHTGNKDGGYIQLNKGINYDENKVDFRYGGHLNDSLYFHVGGYFKNGRGPLHSGYSVSDSYQVKANITKEFDGGNGYIRFLFKFADTQEPNYPGGPALASITNGQVSNIRPFPGYDARRQSNISIHNQTMQIVNRDGVLERVPLDGITTNAKSIQNQFHYEFDGGIKIDNNLRWTDMSGGFASAFLNVAKTSGVIGSTVNGGTVATIRYANGPNAGQIYTGTYLNNNANFRTNIRDIGSFTNDLALSGKFDAGMGTLTARAGWFFMNQKIAIDWHVNKAFAEISGNNPANLDLYTAAGAKLTQDGIAGFNNNWGDCCARDYSLGYANNAGSLNLDFDTDNFALDGSVRFENVKATGWTQQGGAEFNTVVGGVAIGTMLANGKREVLNYSRNYVSWSFGGLYKVSSNTSVFARASKGGRFNGDRQTVGGKIASDGSLCTGAMATAGTLGCSADGVTPSIDFVKQYELGVKTRGDLAGGRFTTELTLLKGNFKQSTFELSATKCPGGAGGCVIDAKYKSYGAELFATYQNGGFSLVANATYSKATRAGSGSNVFSRSPNLPDLSYTLSANYDFGDIATLGVNTTGQTSTLGDDGNRYPGSATIGAVLRVRPVENLELGVQAYNLFNKYDLRGPGNVVDAAAGVIGSGAALGRTFTASVRYSF
jgi:outer membrane receptor protein involved in Fe transport